jgi:hypothetical protein
MDAQDAHSALGHWRSFVAAGVAGLLLGLCVVLPAAAQAVPPQRPLGTGGWCCLPARVVSTMRVYTGEPSSITPTRLVWPDGRIEVFYSAHNGTVMYHRITKHPEDITSSEPEASISTNTPGKFGFTYPNPIRLSAESKTYLFWRGGN